MKEKQAVSFRPRLGVPREILGPFLSASGFLFCVFALTGLFAALVPSLLEKKLHNTSHAVAGATVFAIYIVAALAEVVLQRLESWRAIFLGVGTILPALALLVLALVLRSMAILMGATVLAGIAAGLGFRGSLQIVNQIAPGDRRSEVLSTYYIVGYAGIALPVIGVGVISQLVSPFVANLTFAIFIAVLAIGALVVGATSRE
jgi:MFS family permease